MRLWDCRAFMPNWPFETIRRSGSEKNRVHQGDFRFGFQCEFFPFPKKSSSAAIGFFPERKKCSSIAIWFFPKLPRPILPKTGPCRNGKRSLTTLSVFFRTGKSPRASPVDFFRGGETCFRQERFLPGRKKFTNDVIGFFPEWKKCSSVVNWFFPKRQGPVLAKKSFCRNGKNVLASLAGFSCDHFGQAAAPGPTQNTPDN